VSPLRVVYLVLAVVGAVWPWWYNAAFALAHGGAFDPSVFVAEAFSTPAGGSLSADILVAAAAGSMWMIVEARRLRMRFVWAYVALGTLVAFACAFPLFLFVREGVLQRADAARGGAGGAPAA
jgi:hypothetical protein